MQVTRRCVGLFAVAAVLAGAAAVLARPVLLGGAVTISAWVLARQLTFVRRVERTADALDIEQTVTPSHTHPDESVTVTVTASQSANGGVDLKIEAQPPVAATGSKRSDWLVQLPRNEANAETSFAVSWPVAGPYTFDQPTVTATDRTGLFRSEFPAGRKHTVTVEPRAPKNVHVGRGGDQYGAPYGGGGVDRSGSGQTPARLREYVPGDAADRIDWKATARLTQPYVREFDAETEHGTALMFAHGAATATGPDGERQIDYLRHVALAFLAHARRTEEPVGLYATGDDGLTVKQSPAAGTTWSQTLARQLTALQPTSAGETTVTAVRPRTARQRAKRLQSADDAFSTTLQPFFAAADPYVQRTEDDAFVEAANAIRTERQAGGCTVIFADDTNHAGLKEAVDLVRRESAVSVFLTPTVLFEAGGLADLDRAYEQYREFEELRRDLDRRDGVTAFEVAPGDRLDAVLNGRQRGSVIH